MSSILITGANSFIGTNYIKYSVNKNVREVSLIENKPGEIDFKKVDVVLHLAAIVHQSKKIDDQEYFTINRDLSLQVAEHAKRAGVRQFIFLSTVKVYGTRVKGSGIITENSKCFPDDAYGKSKYEAESLLMEMNDANFTVSVIRTPIVYGEGVKANMRSLIRLVDKFPVLPFGNAENKRNFTFAGNLAGFIDRIIEIRASGVFIAMDEKALTITELVDHISEHLGKRVYMFKLPGILLKAGQAFMPGLFDRLFGSLEFDNTQTLKILNYKAPFPTEEGISRTITSYLKSVMKK